MTEDDRSTTEIDQEFAARNSNISAALAVASSVEGTLGPKGLDTMLVDRLGDVLVTNSGVTILERLDVSHPAARMLVDVAKSQHDRVGDGTTTATVMAGGILKAGMSQIARGVPVCRLLEGIRKATEHAIDLMKKECRISVGGLDDPLLADVALVAGRGNKKLAGLVSSAAKAVGERKMKEPNFKLSELIVSYGGWEDRLVEGVVLAKSRASALMPAEVSPCSILLLDDSLAPEGVEEDALRTESGFRKSMEQKNQFIENLQKILSLGINVIFATGGIDPEAEEILAHSGVFAVRRLTTHALEEIAFYTDAKPLKRNGLKRDPVSLKAFLGKAEMTREEEGALLTIISGGGGKPAAALLVGANTKQVADEKERIAKDAAASLQAAFLDGVVPGGGACELALVRFLEKSRGDYEGMTSYGLDALLEGLKQPFLQMTANAGFNPLEKEEEVLRLQAREGKNSISLDYETGECADMRLEKVYDPLTVKVHALRSASEVAQAILRINRIIKMMSN